MIYLNNVSKTYPNGTVGIKPTSLSIEKGEFVFITGNSGSGKSTLLKLMLKEIEPTHGKISINNKEITKLRRRQVPYLRRDIGVVFQDFRLLPNKTVYENVAFAMQVVQATNKEIRRAVPVVLGLVGLAKKARCYPHELSGGEQQRTAIARAIVNNSPILIADEPTGNLDPATSWEIMTLLQDINLRGVTVIVATHEREIVNVMKKREIEVNSGMIVKDIYEEGYEDEMEYHQVPL
ncbi:cell division ATP-binding protein FtsE [Zhenhengia yiwuensis]|uniref:Cell division ATP-binding protein FtsE n=1 Tax=Zhenhengia yiwuensis TaxID=2763666 RepID=A0A926IE72_9FIRM|nr:cell division ATP-binding protein FtsE [Zhenhengia yiwuensis]MBC8579624.1 cell division ATP-binding protein FtsE [Zhenhengia yiwuensis]